MDRLLLILPSATYRAPDFLMAARELGVVVTVASERRAAMSAAMGERALTLRLSDPALAAEQIAERGRETPFAAVVGVDDQGVMAAALGAERLGLPHNPPGAVARTRDKAAMRGALAEAGVPQPRFALLPFGADVATVAPRSFAALSLATTMARSPSCCMASLLRTLASGSSDSAQTYSPSAAPVTRTDSTRSLGSGAAAWKSRTRSRADAVMARRAEGGSATDLR